MKSAEIRILSAADASAWRALRLEALETHPETFAASANDHRAMSVAKAGDRYFD